MAAKKTDAERLAALQAQERKLRVTIALTKLNGAIRSNALPLDVQEAWEALGVALGIVAAIESPAIERLTND